MSKAFSHPRIQFTRGHDWDAYANKVVGLSEAIMQSFTEVNATSADVDAREVLRKGFGGLGASYTYDQVHFTVKYFDAQRKHLLTKCFKTDANTGSLIQ